MSIDPSSLKSCMLARVQFQRCIPDKLILIGRGTKALDTLVTFLYILYESLNVFWRTSFTKKPFLGAVPRAMFPGFQRSSFTL